MPTLQLKIPPPLVTLVFGALMWAIDQFTPAMSIQQSLLVLVAGALLATGIFVSLAGVVAFRRARTTVNPLKPEAASALVTSGIYRYTRNPMYVGMLLVLTAWGVYLGSALALTCLPLFVLYMNAMQIKPEERVLSRLFGDQFVAYARRVRRWL